MQAAEAHNLETRARRRAELQAEEQQQWERLDAIARSVLARPLLMEKPAARPQSAPPRARRHDHLPPK